MERLTDEQLVERWQSQESRAGGESSLTELFQRHQTKVAAWCYHISGDVNSAADLAQEVFLKAFQSLGSFRKGSKFTTWLYSIARNHCLDELRSRRRRLQDMSEELPDDIGDLSTQRVDSAIEQRETQEIMRELIRNSLDETESQVMILHYVHELPFDSINRLLKLSNASGAKAYIVSARRKLKRAYEQWRSRRSMKAGKNVE